MSAVATYHDDSFQSNHALHRIIVRNINHNILAYWSILINHLPGMLDKVAAKARAYYRVPMVSPLPRCKHFAMLGVRNNSNLVVVVTQGR